jgi:SAM-dependent methyltransferase
MLAFFGIKPGMRVAEIGAAGGYTSELLARTVGLTGVVYAQNSPAILKRFAEEPWSARLATPPMKNVVRVDREFDDPLPPEARNLDAVLIILFYHDTVWLGADRGKMNRAVYDALRPGGIYGIIDHSARPGTGTADVQDAASHRRADRRPGSHRGRIPVRRRRAFPAQPRRSTRLERLAARRRRPARYQRSLRAEVREAGGAERALSDGAIRSADRRVAASRRALRLAVRPDGAAFADWAGAADEVDWDWVVRTARAHKLWALVAARLSTTGVDVAVGGDLPQRVAAARTEAARRGAMSERTLAAVATRPRRPACPSTW